RSTYANGSRHVHPLPPNTFQGAASKCPALPSSTVGLVHRLRSPSGDLRLLSKAEAFLPTLSRWSMSLCDQSSTTTSTSPTEPGSNVFRSAALTRVNVSPRNRACERPRSVFVLPT